MVRFVPRSLSWSKPWPHYCALLVLIFLVRAVFVLSILPPFEGWDEYQHLAHIAFISENGRSPVLGGGDSVPGSLYPALAAYPHSRLGALQLADLGVRDYESFWADPIRPKVNPQARPIRLYQAQQSPLYYWCMTPIYEWCGGAKHILGMVTTLRLINALFAAASVWIALRVVGFLMKEGAVQYLVALLIAFQPLFLINVARVANDAMAIFFGTLAVWALLVLMRRSYWPGVFVAGVALGLGILSKATILSLVPFAAAAFVLPWLQKRLPLTRAALGGLLCLSLVGALTFRYFSFNHMHFGVLTPLQESLDNHAAGKTFGDAARTAGEIDWWGKFQSRYGRHALWFGGWSWLRAPAWMTKTHELLVYVSMIGWSFVLLPRARRERFLFRSGGDIAAMFVLCIGVGLGLGFHAIQSKMALGDVATNAWYAAASFPWLACLFCQGLSLYPTRWVTVIAGSMMLLLYGAAEVYGTFFVMAPHYANAEWSGAVFERLALMHPAALGPFWTFPAVFIAIVLSLLAVCGWYDQCTRTPAAGRRFNRLFRVE